MYGNRKIDMAIAVLRQKLNNARTGAEIKTISNQGYLLDLG